MYNYFMLIGTICKEVEIKEVADGKRVVQLVLAVQRSFANMDGEYDTDFFNISVWEFLAEYANEKLKVGSKIGVKGRLVPKLVKLESGAKVYKNDLIGERIIYFSSPNKEVSIPENEIAEEPKETKED